MKKISLKKRGDDNGYIVVETIGTFVPFVLLVISILSLVNIVTVQARVHYAMTQAANTLSMYSYTLEVLGMADSITKLDKKAENAYKQGSKFKDDVKGVIEGIEGFSDLRGAQEHGQSAVDQIKDVVSDPKAALQSLMNYGLNELKNKLFEELARPLVGRYLSNGELTGDEYLKKVGVVQRNSTGNGFGKTGLGALDFYTFGDQPSDGSVFIDEKENIKLVVRYEIEYTFGGLPLPFRPTLKITQTVKTKAWLNGSGKGFS